MRIPLAVGAAVLGYAAVSQNLAYAMRGAAPETAHAIAPYDGRITALLSEKLSAADVDAHTRGEADRLAKLALRQDATAVPAVATLGINAQIRGDTSAARRIFAYSQFLSRRDLRTQLWAIEDAVARGDVPVVLRQYDIALRTSPVAPDLLFPVLSSAIADSSIRTALVSTLASRPVWSAGFIDHVAAHGIDPGATAKLFAALHHARIPIAQGPPALVVDALVAARRFDEAWTYYSTLRPGADRRASRDPYFHADLETPSVFDWVATNDASVTTSIQSNGARGLFDFSAAPGTGGLLLRQMQMLPVGTYRLQGHGLGIDQPSEALPYWILGCLDGRELGRIVIPNSGQAGKAFGGEFVVPAHCPIQYLSLIARPSEATAGVQGQIDHVQLRPAS